jgi:hypothetical protein
LYKYCIKIYTLSRRWFIVTILIRLILNIIYVAPIISPPQDSPQATFAIDIGLLVLHLTRIWSPSTICGNLNIQLCLHTYDSWPGLKHSLPNYIPAF